MKRSILSKLKKALVVIMIFITMGIAMPKKSNADVLNDFINIVLHIPDGIMAIIDGVMGGSNEFTEMKLNFKGWDEHGYIYNFIVTPYEIFSSGSYDVRSDGMYETKMGYLDINFFSDRAINSDTEVSSTILAPVIANTYIALRNLAMVLMLLVILYIGIKILISSIAEQQAKYKRFLVDWLVGFALLFMMHYIMSAIANFNTLILQTMKNDEGDSYYVGFGELDDVGSVGNTTSTWMDVLDGKKSLKDSSENDVASATLAAGLPAVAPVVVTDELLENPTPANEENFKKNRIVVVNENSETATYSEKIDNFGRLDLGEFNNKVYNGTFNKEKWGDDGVIYLSASICNPTEGTDGFLESAIKFQYKAIGAMTGISVIDTISGNKISQIAEKIWDSGAHPENRENRAILKLNAMSYVRTISSFASNDNDAVALYQNGAVKKASVASTMGYSALYLCLVLETIMFLFIYIKRVLQMAFLTMIAPIVALMYPIDKLGDGKAQSFNSWFRDYLFNVLIQPMHLLLYTVFIVAAGQLVSRNIIYGLAIYGFMIPAEKYFKKVLGFEKASNGGGGPIKDAVGRTLAMDALGKVAGLGPAAGKGGKGGSKDGRGRIKTRKNDAPPTTAPPISSGGGHPGSGGNPTAGGNGGRPSAGGGGRPSAGGNRNRPSAGGNGNRPSANGNNIVTPYGNGAGARMARAMNRRFSKAITGGEFPYISKENGGASAAAAYMGKKIGRMAATGAGSILMSGVGTVAGIATAMATGDVHNIWKGATVGFGAGGKLSGNLYDAGEGFLSDFNDDMKYEMANEVDENGDLTDEANAYNAQLREQEALKNLGESLYNLPKKKREEYEKMIHMMAPYVDINEMKDLKGLIEAKKQYEDAHPGYQFDATIGKEMFDDANGINVLTHRDDYLKRLMRKDGIDESVIREAFKNNDFSHITDWDRYNRRADMIEKVQEAMGRNS